MTLAYLYYVTGVIMASPEADTLTITRIELSIDLGGQNWEVLAADKVHKLTGLYRWLSVRLVTPLR